jgi:hypothetical protein
MTSIQEAYFREAAAELDAMLAAASDWLVRERVSLVDHSARTYHYKNELLSWSVSLSIEWPVGYERAKITVWLTCNQPLDPAARPDVTVRTIAEVFQMSQLSRVREARENVVPWPLLRSLGVAALVGDEMNWGRDAISSS